MEPAVLWGLGAIALMSAGFWDILSWSPRDELSGSVEGMEGWFFSTDGGFPVLTLALAAWMTWRRREALARASAAGASPWMALPIAVPALALSAWSHYLGAPELLVPSLSLTLLTSGALLGGPAGAKALLFPALFALLAWPLPVALVNLVLHPLQMATAAIAETVLDWMAIASVRFGDRVRVGDTIFQVIETCAGLRAMLTMLMSAGVYAELFERPRSRTLLLLGLAPLIGFALNQLRVVTIILNPYGHFSTIHSLQGVAMIVLGVLVIASFDGIADRLRPEREGTEGPGAAPSSALSRFDRRRFVMVAAWLAIFPVISLAMPSWNPPPRPRPPVASLPAHLGPWSIRGEMAPDRVFLGSARFPEFTYRRYERNGREVAVFVAANDRINRFHSLVSPKITLPGTGWKTLREDPVFLGSDHDPATRMLLASEEGSVMSLHWSERIASAGEELLRSTLVLDRGPLRRPGRALVVRLHTPIPDTAEGRSAAEASLRDLAGYVSQWLEEKGILKASGDSP